MADKKVSIRYIGRRMNGDVAVYTFLNGDKEVIFGGKMKWMQIGECYFATMKSGGGWSIMLRPEHDESAVSASEDELEKWQVADALTSNMLRRKRLAAKMDKHPALDRAVNAIRPLIKGLDFSQRRQLIEILFSKASKGKDGWVE